jgi:hypothetical protein
VRRSRPRRRCCCCDAAARRRRARGAWRRRSGAAAAAAAAAVAVRVRVERSGGQMRGAAQRERSGDAHRRRRRGAGAPARRRIGTRSDRRRRREGGGNWCMHARGARVSATERRALARCTAHVAVSRPTKRVRTPHTAAPHVTAQPAAVRADGAAGAQHAKRTPRASSILQQNESWDVFLLRPTRLPPSPQAAAHALHAPPAMHAPPPAHRRALMSANFALISRHFTHFLCRS